MSADITVSVEGRRVYVGTPYGHPITVKLKTLGAKWDAETRRWWVGTGKAAQVDNLIADAGSASPPDGVPDSARVYAKVTYKGKRYLVVAETDAGRCRLAALDGKIDFWVDMAECELVRRYEPREVRSGYGRYTRTEYTTLGSLRRFAARQADPATRRGPCTECGNWGPSGEPCGECGGEGTHA